MIRSYYIASTAMLTQADKLDVLTNNLTNADTTGYKKDKLISRSFADMLIDRLNDPAYSSTKLVGAQNSGIHVDEIATDFAQGGFEETARLSDLGLEGTGFFVIETPDGDRYTRDGSFYVDKQGYLTNSNGYYVSGTNGHIYVGNSDFVVDAQGNVVVGGQVTNKLELVTFDDLTGLRKQKDNLYSSTQAARTAGDVVVKQGWLENSNVDTSEELVNMMEITRAFEMNQRVLTMLDQSLEKAVNDVGRI